MMTNGDREGSIVQFHSSTNNIIIFHFLLISKHGKYPIFMFSNRLPEVPDYAEILHNMMAALQHNNDVTCISTCGCTFSLSFPQVGTEYVR